MAQGCIGALLWTIRYFHAEGCLGGWLQCLVDQGVFDPILLDANGDIWIFVEVRLAESQLFLSCDLADSKAGGMSLPISTCKLLQACFQNLMWLEGTLGSSIRNGPQKFALTDWMSPLRLFRHTISISTWYWATSKRRWPRWKSTRKRTKRFTGPPRGTSPCCSSAGTGSSWCPRPWGALLNQICLKPLILYF